jgi:hypothetical protein
VKRGRDRLGRPVPLGSPQALPDVPEQALPRTEALALAQALLDEGRCFAAHEVLEASWKAAPAHERVLWQGLAQVCVGATHLQRGNTVGAARLLRRGAGRLQAPPTADVLPDDAVERVRGWALRLADAVESGAVAGGHVEAPRSGPDGPLRLVGT